MIENFKNILEIFPLEWFNDESNSKHPLYILNEKEKYLKEYFEIFDNNLKVIRDNGLISKDLKTKLRNSSHPSQFEDTLIEVKAAVILLSKGFKINLPNTFPDIEVPDMNTIIEIKNLHTSDKILDATGDYAVEIDDIKKIWDRISEKILPKLEDDKINLILINVNPLVEFDEFEDLLIFCERSREGGVKYTYDRKTKQFIWEFKGEFSKGENKNISAVIMMKNNHFKGIINPLNDKQIPTNLKEMFNLIEFEIK